jgi:hypothetical protein
MASFTEKPELYSTKLINDKLSIDGTGGIVDYSPELALWRFVDGIHDFADNKILGDNAKESLALHHNLKDKIIEKKKLTANKSIIASSGTSSQSPDKQHKFLNLRTGNMSDTEYEVLVNDITYLSTTSPIFLTGKTPIKLKNIDTIKDLIPSDPMQDYILSIKGSDADFYNNYDKINTLLDNRYDNVNSNYSQDSSNMGNDFYNNLFGKKNGKNLLANLVDPGPGKTDPITDHNIEVKLFYTHIKINDNAYKPLFAKFNKEKGPNNNNKFSLQFSFDNKFLSESSSIINLDTTTKNKSPTIGDITKYLKKNYPIKNEKSYWVPIFKQSGKIMMEAVKQSGKKIKKAIKSAVNEINIFKFTKKEIENLKCVDWSRYFNELINETFKNLMNIENMKDEIHLIYNLLISYKTIGDQMYFFDALGIQALYKTGTTAVVSGDKFLIDYVNYTKKVDTINPTAKGGEKIIEIYKAPANLTQEEIDKIEKKAIAVAKVTKENVDKLKQNIFGKNTIVQNIMKTLEEKHVHQIADILNNYDIVPISRRNITYTNNNVNIPENICIYFYYATCKLYVDYLYYINQIIQVDTLLANAENDKDIIEIKLIKDDLWDFNESIKNYPKYDDSQNIREYMEAFIIDIFPSIFKKNSEEKKGFISKVKKGLKGFKHIFQSPSNEENTPNDKKYKINVFNKIIIEQITEQIKSVCSLKSFKNYNYLNAYMVLESKNTNYSLQFIPNIHGLNKLYNLLVNEVNPIITKYKITFEQTSSPIGMTGKIIKTRGGVGKRSMFDSNEDNNMDMDKPEPDSNKMEVVNNDEMTSNEDNNMDIDKPEPEPELEPVNNDEMTSKELYAETKELINEELDFWINEFNIVCKEINKHELYNLLNNDDIIQKYMTMYEINDVKSYEYISYEDDEEYKEETNDTKEEINDNDMEVDNNTKEEINDNDMELDNDTMEGGTGPPLSIQTEVFTTLINVVFSINDIYDLMHEINKINNIDTNEPDIFDKDDFNTIDEKITEYGFHDLLDYINTDDVVVKEGKEFTIKPKNEVEDYTIPILQNIPETFAAIPEYIPVKGLFSKSKKIMNSIKFGRTEMTMKELGEKYPEKQEQGTIKNSSFVKRKREGGKKTIKKKLKKKKSLKRKTKQNKNKKKKSKRKTIKKNKYRKNKKSIKK